MIRSLRLFMVHTPSMSVGFAYAALNLLYGSLFARLPEIQNALLLTQGQLGIALLGMSIGGLLVIPLSGWLVSRYATGKLLYYGGLLMSLSFALLLIVNSYFILFAVLLAIGITNGVMGVFVNAAAAAIERTTNRSIMNTCHGLFSVGGMVGAATASLVAGYGISISIHLSLVILLLFSLIFFLRPIFLNLPESSNKTLGFSLPSKPLWGLAGVAFFIIMAEVAVMDWSAVYLKNSLNSSNFVTGLGFAGFSLAMAIGRFYGDSIISTIGARRIAMIGSYIGISGLCIAAFFPYPIMAILGFTIVGLGFSCIVPILFGGSAKIPGIDPGTGIATIATAGMLGILLGRPMMGFIAEQFGLDTGFGLLAILVIGATFLIRRLNF